MCDSRNDGSRKLATNGAACVWVAARPCRVGPGHVHDDSVTVAVSSAGEPAGWLLARTISSTGREISVRSGASASSSSTPRRPSASLSTASVVSGGPRARRPGCRRRRSRCRRECAARARADALRGDAAASLYAKTASGRGAARRAAAPSRVLRRCRDRLRIDRHFVRGIEQPPGLEERAPVADRALRDAVVRGRAADERDPRAAGGEQVAHRERRARRVVDVHRAQPGRPRSISTSGRPVAASASIVSSR